MEETTTGLLLWSDKHQFLNPAALDCQQMKLLSLRRGSQQVQQWLLTPSFLLRILTYPCFTMSLKLEAMVRGSGSLPIRKMR